MTRKPLGEKPEPLAVECPDCGARPGDACTRIDSAGPVRREQPHYARRQAAGRALREAQG